MARELKPFVFQPTKAAKSCTQDTIAAERLIAAFRLEMAVKVLRISLRICFRRRGLPRFPRVCGDRERPALRAPAVLFR